MPMMTIEAIEALSKGAELAGRDKERERCAKIADDPKAWDYPPGQGNHPFPANKIHREAGDAIARTIRLSE